MADGYAILLHFGAQSDLVRLQSAFSPLLPEGTHLTDPETFHITLAYATGQGDVDRVREWVSGWDALQFAVIVDGLRVFDTPEDGYAFYLNVRNMGTLTDYQGVMYAALYTEGFEMSGFSHPSAWQPHITIGYSDTPAEKLSPQMSIGFVPPIAVMPHSIQISDPDYRIIGEVVLKQARIEKRRITYNGVTVEATGRRASSRDDKKYERTVTVGGKDYLVHYGDPDMPMRRTNDEARANFLSRHNCGEKTDPRAPGFWACYDWEEVKARASPVKKEGRVISRRNFERLRAIRDALQQILDDAQLSFEETPVTGKAFIVKGTDGLRYLGMISSNPYRDRDNEYVAQKALQAFVDSEWKGDRYVGGAPVLFWHEGEPIGDIIWADIEKGFLIEVARERPTAWAKAMFDLIERSDLDWGCSIGFKTNWYDETITALGKVASRVYRKIRRVETSVLPRAYAANPFTAVKVQNDD